MLDLRFEGVGSGVCEEVVDSAVGAVDVESQVGCSVEAEVFATADVAEVIVLLVGFFVSLVCVAFLVSSGVGSAVCEEVVGSAVGAIDVE